MTVATFDLLFIYEVIAYDHATGTVYVRFCARGAVSQLPMREFVVSLIA